MQQLARQDKGVEVANTRMSTWGGGKRRKMVVVVLDVVWWEGWWWGVRRAGVGRAPSRPFPFLFLMSHYTTQETQPLWAE
jgi:hypothetical protein